MGAWTGLATGFFKSGNKAFDEKARMREKLLDQRFAMMDKVYDEYRAEQRVAKTRARDMAALSRAIPGASFERLELGMAINALGDPDKIEWLRSQVPSGTPAPAQANITSLAGIQAGQIMAPPTLGSGDLTVPGGRLIGDTVIPADEINQMFSDISGASEADIDEFMFGDSTTGAATGSGTGQGVTFTSPEGRIDFDKIWSNLEDSRDDLPHAAAGKQFVNDQVLAFGGTQEQADDLISTINWDIQEWGPVGSRYSHNQFIGEFFGRTADYRNANDAKNAAISQSRARGATPEEVELIKNLDYTNTKWGSGTDSFDLAKFFKSFLVNSHLFKDEAAARKAMEDHIKLSMTYETEESKAAIRTNLAATDLGVYTWGDQALIRASEKAKADEANIVIVTNDLIARGINKDKAGLLARGLPADWVDKLYEGPNGGVHELPEKFLTESDTKNIRNEVGHALATNDTKGIWNVLGQFSSFGNIDLNDIASNVNNMAAIEWGNIVKESFISGTPIDPKDNIFAIVSDMKEIQLALYAAQKIIGGVGQQAGGTWGGADQAIKDLDKVGEKLHAQVRAGGAIGQHADSLITSATNHLSLIDLEIYTGWAMRHDGTEVLHLDD